jgi:O-antigen ligase
MKIKAFYIPVLLIFTNFILSVPQFEWSKNIGGVRLLIIPVLILLILGMMGRIGLTRTNQLLAMSWPLMMILVLFIVQIFFIPSSALEMHLSGCIKYVSWILTYIYGLMTLTHQTAFKIKDALFLAFVLLFLGIILQYPSFILSSPKSIGEVFAFYGSTEGDKSTHGLFASANEDANGLIALLPFFLAFVESQSGLKKLVLRLLVLSFLPIALLFNGTRTALFISFPVVLFLFYSNLSLKTILRLLPLAGIVLSVFSLYAGGLFSQAFKNENLSEGNLGWRIVTLWLPTITYTSEHSPIIGFGSRGWDYVCLLNKIFVITESGRVVSSFDVTPAHNVYIWVYVSWGLVGLLLYLSLLILFLKESFWLSIASRKDISTLGKASFCSVIAYCIWAAISNATIEVGWLILISLGMIISALKIMALMPKATSIHASPPLAKILNP